MAEIKWNDHLEEDIKALLKAKMHEGAQIVLEEAQGESPVKSGMMRATGRIEDEGDDVLIKFGGGMVDYALMQHEVMYFYHPVGKAKYLEDPFNRNKQNIIDIIKEGVEAMQ